MLGLVDDVRESAGALRRFRLPDTERLGSAGEAAGGVRRWNSGGLDHHRRRRAGGKDGEFCALADNPEGFAERVVALLEDPAAAAAMATRARAEVEAHWDMAAITRKLVEGYREMVPEKRKGG